MKLRVLGLTSILVGSALFIAGCPSKNNPTAPPGPTPTFTIAGTATNSPTNTASPTITATPTKTATATITGTPTHTATSTNTGTPTNSATATPTATITETPTVTGTPTNTATMTPTDTPCGYPGNTCTPTATSTPAATSTPNPNGPIIVALVSGVLDPLESVIVSNSAGTTGAGNDGVTMITQGVTTAMEYDGQGSPQDAIDQLKGNYGFPSTIMGDDFSAQTYPSNGQVFQFEVSIGGTVYSNSVTYIADSNAALTVVSGMGVQCTWTSGLTNRDFVSITDSDEIGAGTVTQIGPPLPSDPCTILNSAFSNETTPGSGHDDVLLWLTQIQNSAFPGSNSQSAAGSIDAAFYYPY
jgi:hypothetical protein